MKSTRNYTSQKILLSSILFIRGPFTFHCKGFSRAGLAICKNSAIIAHNNFIQNWTNNTSVNINLFSTCSKNHIKSVRFTWAFVRQSSSSNTNFLPHIITFCYQMGISFPLCQIKWSGLPLHSPQAPLHSTSRKPDDRRVFISLLPFLNPACTSGSSWFTIEALTWRILSITLLCK